MAPMRREIHLASPDDRRNWFRRGIEDWYKLRWSIRILLTLSFAAVFVAVAWPLLFGIGNWLGTVWGIDPKGPVRGQPHDVAWLVTFLFAFLAVMLLIYGLWCAVLTVWLVAVRNWSSTDAYNAIFSCRYPRHWFKP